MVKEEFKKFEVLDLGGLLNKHLSQQEKLSEKEITLRILKGESYLKIAEELQEFTAEEVKQIFVSTTRKAIKNSDRPTDSALTPEEWIELVESI